MGFLADNPLDDAEALSTAQATPSTTQGSSESSTDTISSSTQISGFSTASLVKKHQSQVKFKIHYQAIFGQSLYVVGSIKALGKWRIEKSLQMKWTEGHYWVASLASSEIDSAELDKLIEYKYCLANTVYPEQYPILWEEGPNRSFYFPEVSQLCLNDFWSLRKVILRLFEAKNANDLYILGDCEELGTYESPSKMERVVQTNFADLSKTVFFEKTLLVKAHKQKIKYTYAKKDTNQMLIIDRQPRKLQIKQPPKHIHIEINDNSFSSKFQVTKIDDNIYLGPYPQSEEDVKELSERGIKAVLNLQTEKDMQLKGAAYIKLLRFYKAYNIQPFQFPVIDMDVIDMCYKLQDVSRLLNYLVSSMKRVYVHCTAGMFRSPQCVIGYYTYFKNMKVQQAIKFVESQHPHSKINKGYIETIMNCTPVPTYNSMNDIDKKYQKNHISDSDFFDDDDDDDNNNLLISKTESIININNTTDNSPILT
ncbi:hypothetical protein ABPG74_017637 [Tetrahymena malaccensis]